MVNLDTLEEPDIWPRPHKKLYIRLGLCLSFCRVFSPRLYQEVSNINVDQLNLFGSLRMLIYGSGSAWSAMKKYSISKEVRYLPISLILFSELSTSHGCPSHLHDISPSISK